MKYIIMIDLSKICSRGRMWTSNAFRSLSTVIVTQVKKKHLIQCDSIGKMDDDKQHVSLHTLI